MWAVLSWNNKKNNQWDEQEFFKTGEQEIQLVMDYVKKLNIQLETARALDFGCGVGRLTQALSPYFTAVVGADISEEMVAKAGLLNKKQNCSYIVNTVPNLKVFTNNTFSFIYSRLTFQHMEPRYTKQYIQEFIRTLKPAGIAIFVQPYKKTLLPFNSHKLSAKDTLKLIIPTSLQNLLRNIKGALFGKPVMELHSMSRQEVLAILDEQNVKIVSVDEFGDLGGSWICYRYCIQKLK